MWVAVFFRPRSEVRSAPPHFRKKSGQLTEVFLIFFRFARTTPHYTTGDVQWNRDMCTCVRDQELRAKVGGEEARHAVRPGRAAPTSARVSTSSATMTTRRSLRTATHPVRQRAHGVVVSSAVPSPLLSVAVPAARRRIFLNFTRASRGGERSIGSGQRR